MIVTVFICAHVGSVSWDAKLCGDPEILACKLSSEAMKRYPDWYVHSDLDLPTTAARIVQFARQTLVCDRASLLVPRGGRWKVIQVSGVVKIHRHSATVRAMQSAAKMLLPCKQTMVCPIDDDRSPQEDAAIDQLLDATEAASFVLLPLQSLHDLDTESEPQNADWANSPIATDAPLIGALLCERFSGEAFRRDDQRFDQVRTTCGIALRNACRFHAIPARRLLSALGWSMSASVRWKTILATLAVALGLLAVHTIQVTHWVEATGTLTPAVSHHLFAPANGIVSEVLCQHGELVQQGQVLVRMHSSQLERLRQQLQGDLITSKQRLTAIKAQTITTRQTPGGETQAYDPRLTEQLQLEANLQNLQLQLQIVQEELKLLEIRAPLAGRIATWNVSERLEQRPVSMGDMLLTVDAIDARQAWILRLQVPQMNVEPIVSAPGGIAQRPIKFRLGTMPEKSFEARLQRLASATQVDEELGNVLPAEAAVTSLLAIDLTQSGSAVRARIDCGTASIWRSHFHAFRHWWHYRLRFWLAGPKVDPR